MVTVAPSDAAEIRTRGGSAEPVGRGVAVGLGVAEPGFAVDVGRLVADGMVTETSARSRGHTR
jgi:hypothetical protein